MSHALFLFCLVMLPASVFAEPPGGHAGVPAPVAAHAVAPAPREVPPPIVLPAKPLDSQEAFKLSDDIRNATGGAIMPGAFTADPNRQPPLPFEKQNYAYFLGMKNFLPVSKKNIDWTRSGYLMVNFGERLQIGDLMPSIVLPWWWTPEQMEKALAQIPSKEVYEKRQKALADKVDARQKELLGDDLPFEIARMGISPTTTAKEYFELHENLYQWIKANRGMLAGREIKNIFPSTSTSFSPSGQSLSIDPKNNPADIQKVIALIPRDPTATFEALQGARPNQPLTSEQHEALTGLLKDLAPVVEQKRAEKELGRLHRSEPSRLALKGLTVTVPVNGQPNFVNHVAAYKAFVARLDKMRDKLPADLKHVRLDVAMRGGSFDVRTGIRADGLLTIDPNWTDTQIQQVLSEVPEPAKVAAMAKEVADLTKSLSTVRFFSEQKGARVGIAGQGGVAEQLQTLKVLQEAAKAGVQFPGDGTFIYMGGYPSPAGKTVNVFGNQATLSSNVTLADIQKYIETMKKGEPSGPGQPGSIPLAKD